MTFGRNYNVILYTVFASFFMFKSVCIYQHISINGYTSGHKTRYLFIIPETRTSITFVDPLQIVIFTFCWSIDLVILCFFKKIFTFTTALCLYNTLIYYKPGQPVSDYFFFCLSHVNFSKRKTLFLCSFRVFPLPIISLTLRRRRSHDTKTLVLFKLF